MTFDTNVAFDHLIPRKVRTTAGPARIDLEDLVGYTEAVKARGVLLGIVKDEVDNGLVGALYDTYGHRLSLHRLRRYERNARKRMQRVFERLEIARPPVPAGSIADARRFFARHPRDLSSHAVRPKDPVPGTNDLTILIQLATLGHPAHLVTRDAHFLAYTDLIQEKWRISVHHGARLPILLEEWRAKK